MNFISQLITEDGLVTSVTVTAFEESVDDRVAALLVAGTNVTIVYDDPTNTLTINSTGGGGQPLDATLTALAALTIAANSLTIGTGVDAFSQITFAANTFPARASTGGLVAKPITDFALSILDDADAATVRGTIGAGTSSFDGAYGSLSGIPATFAPSAHVHAAGDITSGTMATARLGTGTADATTFLRGDQTWAVPSGGAGGHTIKDEGTPLTARAGLNFVGAGVTVTDDAAGNESDVTIPGYSAEEAQDAVGTILVDSARINLTYTDATPSITADLIADTITAGFLHANATNVFFGRDTAAAGPGEEITASAARTMLSIDQLDNTSDLAKPVSTATQTAINAAVVGLWDFKGAIDCSANPNYPAALKGDTYVVSIAGKIGGASGVVVSVGDIVLATADNAGGTQAAVGASWTILEANIPLGAGDVVGPASATDNAIVRFDGATGKLLQDSSLTVEDEGQVTQRVTTPTSSVVTDVFSIYHFTSGTAAAGFGSKLDFHLEDDGGNLQQAGNITVSWSDAAQTTRKGLLTLNVNGAGFVVTGVSVGIVGTAAAIGFLGATPVIRQTGDAGAALVALGLMSGTPSFVYANLTGIPSTFAPSAHTHPSSEIDAAATSRILGRITAGAGAVEELTGAQVAQIIGVDPGICEGRLTLTTGTAVTTADVTAAGTIYFAPFHGSKVALFDGTNWKLHTFTERSLALTLTSGKNYDVFLYDNAGTLTLELSAAWTNDTTRADALTTQDGVMVKSGATTRRYLGTIRASGTNTTEDSFIKRYVWNMYNRVPRLMRELEGTASWTYNSATWRRANGATGDANVIRAVVGLAEVAANIRVQGYSSGTSGSAGSSGIGLNSTTVNSAINHAEGINNPTATAYATMTVARLDHYPAIGLNEWYWIEQARAGTVTFYGTSFGQFGITGEIMG